MSIVSSYFSSRSTALGLNPQFASMMDSIFAIGVGLAVRFVIGAVSHNDVKVTGTLVGLWEGVVMQHFLRKMPTSFDPYVAYGVRLFIDFLFTESLPRLVLVLVWTGMGVILADIAPALWIDAGMRRIWRRFRRDLYVMSRSMPSVPYPRTRTVRFSPSRTPSVISSLPPSVFTTNTQDPRHLAVPPPALRKRHVPGAFPGDVSETETDIGSILGLRDDRSQSPTTPGTTNRRFSSFMRRQFDFGTETDISTDMNDLDEANLSSSASSYSTETPDASAFNLSEIPDYDEDEAVVVEEKKPEESDHEATPKQNNIPLLPTPPDSFALHRQDEPDGMQPPPDVPVMPDEDWEEISKREAIPTPPPTSKELPPIPLVNDDPPLATSSIPPPPQQAPATNDTQPTTAGENHTHNDDPIRFNDQKIDFFNDDFPMSSQQPRQQQPSLDPFSPAFPPRLSSELDDMYGAPPSGSPPPPFQDSYRQADTIFDDFGSSATLVQPTPGDQTATNNAANDTNENPLNKPNRNDIADSNKEDTTPAGAGTGQGQDGNDQAQASSSAVQQTLPAPLDKGKAKDANANGGSTGPKRGAKSRSGQSTPRAGSKPPSDDEGTGPSRPESRQGNASTAMRKRASFTGGNGRDNDKGANGGNGSAKRQSGSVVGDADGNIPKTGPEAQHDTSAQSTTAAGEDRSSPTGDKPKADDKTTITAGNNAEEQAKSAQADSATTRDAAKRRSVTFDTNAPDNKTTISGEVGDQRAGTTPALTGDVHTAGGSGDKKDNDEVDNANGDEADLTVERSQPNEQAEAGPSTVTPVQATPSPSTSETSDLPKTSEDRLRQALELRKQCLPLNKMIQKLERQYNTAVSKGSGDALKRKAELDDAEKEREQLSKKITRRLAAHSLTDAKADIDVSELSDEALGPAVEDVLAQLLLRNQPKLDIKVDKAKNQRGTIISLLKNHGLGVDNNVKARVVVKIPFTP